MICIGQKDVCVSTYLIQECLRTFDTAIPYCLRTNRSGIVSRLECSLWQLSTRGVDSLSIYCWQLCLLGKPCISPVLSHLDIWSSRTLRKNHHWPGQYHAYQFRTCHRLTQAHPLSSSSRARIACTCSVADSEEDEVKMCQKRQNQHVVYGNNEFSMFLRSMRDACSPIFYSNDSSLPGCVVVFSWSKPSMRTARTLDAGRAGTGITKHTRPTIDTADTLCVGLKTAKGTHLALCLVCAVLEPPLGTCITVAFSRTPLGTSGHAGQTDSLCVLVLKVSSRAGFTLSTRRPSGKCRILAHTAQGLSTKLLRFPWETRHACCCACTVDGVPARAQRTGCPYPHCI